MWKNCKDARPTGANAGCFAHSMNSVAAQPEVKAWPALVLPEKAATREREIRPNSKGLVFDGNRIFMAVGLKIIFKC